MSTTTTIDAVRCVIEPDFVEIELVPVPELGLLNLVAVDEQGARTDIVVVALDGLAIAELMSQLTDHRSFVVEDFSLVDQDLAGECE